MAITKRGVIVSDVPTSLLPVIRADCGAIGPCGTAPVRSLPGFTFIAGGYKSVVNRPILCEIASDFTTQLGESTDWASYDLMEVYDAAMIENSVSPLIPINVYDPFKHSRAISIATAAVTAKKQALIPNEVILASLVVTGTAGVIYKQGIDFSFAYDDPSLKTATLSIFTAGPMRSDLTVKLDFTTRDLTLITNVDIIGGVDINGNYLVLENVENVYTITDIVPGTVICPKYEFDPAVIAAGNARAQSISNGRFRGVSCWGADTTTVKKYEDLLVWKNSNNVVSAFEFCGWPLGGLGTAKKYHFSTILAVAMLVTDAKFNNIPYVSPSNKGIWVDRAILADGTQIDMDLAQSDAIENWGLVNIVNSNGWRLIGDFTCAYPVDTDVHDMWIPLRRMFNWLGNSLGLTLAQDIDLPGNKTTLGSIGLTIQQFGNSLVQEGACNTFRVRWLPADNLAADVMVGIYKFHILWTPPTPIRTLDILLEYDVAGLTARIRQITISSSESI